MILLIYILKGNRIRGWEWRAVGVEGCSVEWGGSVWWNVRWRRESGGGEVESSGLGGGGRRKNPTANYNSQQTLVEPPLEFKQHFLALQSPLLEEGTRPLW